MIQPYLFYCFVSSFYSVWEHFVVLFNSQAQKGNHFVLVHGNNTYATPLFFFRIQLIFVSCHRLQFVLCFMIGSLSSA